jgi:nucleotide-binding universal stress UspA family protein
MLNLSHMQENGMYKKVLVPLDGSALSEQALDKAADIVTNFEGSELVLLNVIEPFKDLDHWVSDETASKMQKEAERVARKYLDQIVERLSKAGIKVEAVVTSGNPGEVILEYAAKYGVDLISMSTHGRSGFSRLWFGSVASQVINNSRSPVLLTPASGLASHK